MTIQLPVYVIGFGDIYREFFNAVASVLGSPVYGKLIKLMALLGGFWTLVLASIKGNHTFNIRWMITYFFLTGILLLPNVTVVIQDRTNQKMTSVAHIPLGLGLLASITTSIGTGFTELVESVFHMPNDLEYSHSGLLMGSKLIHAASQFQIKDENFRNNLQEFVSQCIFYDILLKKYSIQDLSNKLIYGILYPPTHLLHEHFYITIKLSLVKKGQ